MWTTRKSDIPTLPLHSSKIGETLLTWLGGLHQLHVTDDVAVITGLRHNKQDDDTNDDDDDMILTSLLTTATAFDCSS